MATNPRGLPRPQGGRGSNVNTKSCPTGPGYGRGGGRGGGKNR